MVDTVATDTTQTETSVTDTTQTSTETTPAVSDNSTPNPDATTKTDTQTDTSTTQTDDDEEPAVKESDWATLRKNFAKGDEKLEQRLSRYSTMESALEALVAAQNKIAKGLTKAPYPAEGTPEEQAAWRTQNEIPESPDKYDISLAEGLIMGEEDKPLVNEFLAHMHKENATNSQVNAAVNWYMNMREEEANAIAENDASVRESADEAVREVWGSEYKMNKQLILNMMSGAPEGLGDLLLSGRLGDGTPIFSHPAALRWFADTARTLNPIATVVPGHGQNASQAMEDEISSIEKQMADQNSDYWSKDKGPKIQERYRKLLDAKERYSTAN